MADAGKTYTYTITETTGFGAGWSISGPVTATVAVTNNGDGTLAAEVTYSPDNKTITNSYSANGEATLQVTKAISGADWPKDDAGNPKTLTFTLSGTGSAPMPTTTTVTLSAPGTASFPKISYTDRKSVV